MSTYNVKPRLILFVCFIVLVNGSLIDTHAISFRDSINTAFSSSAGMLALALICTTFYQRLKRQDIFLIFIFSLIGVFMHYQSGQVLSEVHGGSLIAIFIILGHRLFEIINQE